MNFNPNQPYNALPLLPPKADIENRSILKRCIEARAMLAELKQAGELIPYQGILINNIPLLEAQASSEIENIVTTSDRMFQFVNDMSDRADVATKEALRYSTALYNGFEALEKKPLTTSTAVEVCRTLLGVDIDIRRLPGTALINDVDGRVIYTPPEGEALLREKLADWESFIHNQTDIDPLIRMAVMHYQFEAIHPFNDGNGRTGRILNLLYLVEQDLLRIPVLYLSRYIIQNKKDYYRLLSAVTTEENWEEWILFMLNAVIETAQWTTDKIRSIRALMRKVAERVKEKAPGVYTHELIEVIFEHPYCRISDVIEKGLAKRDTASAYLKKLCEINVLVERKLGRDKFFINPLLMKLLSDKK